MGDAVINIQNLSKRYLIDHQKVKGDGLRHLMEQAMRNPWQCVTRRIKERKIEVEEFWALNDVSFEVKQGGVVGIIGRNGAGKSTLLKVLSRITEPTRGSIRLRGRVASLLEVGTGFHPELTGRENIFLNGAILGMTREEIRKRFDEIVAFSEVERFLDTPVKRYSSGMYVRLAFAVAAHLEPEILIVDEVLAVGDVEFQKKCLKKMGDAAHNRGRTILFVSHNVAAIQTICESALYLRQGRLAGYGPVDEQVNAYLRDAEKSFRMGQGLPRELSREIALTAFDFEPEEIRVGDDIGFNLALRSSQPNLVKDCALLVYSERGTRVAVVDLRSPEVDPTMQSGQEWRVSGMIRSLNLIEGNYSAGIYLRCGDCIGDYHDLAVFRVRRRKESGVVAPYDAQYRGCVELDYSFRRIEGGVTKPNGA